MKSSSELKSELADTKKRAKALNGFIADAKEALAKLEAEQRELCGSGWGSSKGKIGRLENEIAAAELRESDENAPRVIWKKKPRFSGGDDRVVRKVTKKRIFIARPGHNRCEQFNRDGTWTRNRDEYYGIIDVEATLGEDITPVGADGS